MKSIGVIPARWASARFPGKVLAEFNGKSMLQHVWERAKAGRQLSDVLIACDHENVLNAARKFGAKAVMTSADHPSGTDRIAEAVKDLDVEIVVNVQADEPLIRAKMIDDLVEALSRDSYAQVATLILPVTNPVDLDNPNVVKVVIDHNGYALYFSRSKIPFDRDRGADAKNYYKHIGIYAYRKNFLMGFKSLPASKLETTEKLEQLRVLEAGYKIKTVVTEFETAGVDTMEDFERVKEILEREGL
ncbi:MAG: 3-deoxy-manno-octulosonate cytidylyltransferase [Candidatus Omnitrophica bacterium CG12_big_fil_rev_8_21_14_0_65_50_5]|nr:MAG: 3-deoxy-manno-octulosonate cytidylyltransferase [Candidatus Omnitrophica bacterium CG12_big_fil_rev_8_21_14_0_65_50_5]